jgi:lysophospholipase L1-like esterase
MRILFLAILNACLIVSCAQAPVQKPPFFDEIQAFHKQDSAHFPARGQILFVGSSTFRIWTDAAQYFPGYPILNRAFGGSTLPDQIRYADEVITPYRPRQIVIYCGDNDLASSDTISAQTVAGRFATWFVKIRNRLPNVPIAFVSIKPSPSRVMLMPKMEKANELIRTYLSKQQHTAFIDVYHAMLGADGKPRKELFKEDQLHMNAKGYEIWRPILQPYLIK